MRQINSTSIENNSAKSLPMQDKNTFLITDLSCSLRDVFQSLQELSKKGCCFASIKKLAKKSGYSRRTVQRVLNKLKKLNYIKIKSCFSSCGGRLENCYILIR